VQKQKDSLAAGVGALERDLDRVARETAREQPEASRRLTEGAAAIRDSRVVDKLRASKMLVRGGSPEYVHNIEEQITSNLDDVRDRVAEAVAATRATSGQRTQDALDRARALAQGMASLADRMRQAREDASLRPNNGDASKGDAAKGDQSKGDLAQGDRANGDRPNGGQPNGARPNGARPNGQGQRGGQQADASQSAGSQSAGSQSSGSPTGGSPTGAGDRPLGIGPLGPAAYGGRLDREDARQFSRELRERRTEAEALRRDLAAQGIDTKELDALLQRMRALEGTPMGDLTDNVLAAQQAVAEGLESFEFGLRRKLAGAAADGPRLGRSDEVPPGYRALVDEYFKALARGRQP